MECAKSPILVTSFAVNLIINVEKISLFISWGCRYSGLTHPGREYPGPTCIWRRAVVFEPVLQEPAPKSAHFKEKSAQLASKCICVYSGVPWFKLYFRNHYLQHNRSTREWYSVQSKPGSGPKYFKQPISDRYLQAVERFYRFV